jgi:hypothetical protein
MKSLGNETLTAHPATNFYPICVSSSPILMNFEYLLDASSTFVRLTLRYREVELGGFIPQVTFRLFERNFNFFRNIEPQRS